MLWYMGQVPLIHTHSRKTQKAEKKKNQEEQQQKKIKDALEGQK